MKKNNKKYKRTRLKKSKRIKHNKKIPAIQKI